MPAMDKDISLEVSPALDGSRLDGAVRDALGNPSWSRVRGWIQSGKLRIDGRVELDPGFRLRLGQRVELLMNAPKPEVAGRLTSQSIAFVDAHLVVVRKPAGISSVPYDRGERGTLQEMVRAWINRSAVKRNDRGRGELGVVHRIDKETSGLLVFTRTFKAKQSLDAQLRDHTVERRYFAVAHGRVKAGRIETRLVADRGDGVRGSTRNPKLGRVAITHVTPEEELEGATLVSCRLETGRTHQIRIHLAERGHPLLGEKVYIRGLPGPFLPAPRMMLHAAVLGFEHPAHGSRLRFEDPMPEDMRELVASLRRGAAR